MDHQWQTLQRRTAYQGYFRLERFELRHTLFRGGWGTPIVRERIERGDVVAVLPYDPLRDEVVLIEQFRVGALEDPDGAWLVEIVAGVAEEGESLDEVAAREVMEETGCRVGALLPVCRYYSSPGTTSERVHLYCARVDATGAEGVHGLAEEGEDIRVFRVPAAVALEDLERGGVTSAIPLVALQWFAAHRERLRAAWS